MELRRKREPAGTAQPLPEGLNPVEVWNHRWVADGLWRSDTLRRAPPAPDLGPQIVDRRNSRLAPP